MILAGTRSPWEAWHVHRFLAGAAGGTAAVLILFGSGALVSAAISRRGHWQRPFPIAGLAFAIAGLGTVRQSHALPVAVVVGVSGAAAVGAMTGWSRVPRWVPLFLMVPFALLIGREGGLVAVGWLRVLVVVTISLGAPLAARIDDSPSGSTVGPILLAVSVAGAWATVPDTEEAVALVGAVVLPTLLSGPLKCVRLGRSGAAASVALLVWVAAIDGRGRPTSVIGAVIGLGLLVMVPAVRRDGNQRSKGLRGRPLTTRQWSEIAVVAHIAIVLNASRLIGFVTDVTLAAMSGVALAVIGFLVASAVAASDPTVGTAIERGPLRR